MELSPQHPVVNAFILQDYVEAAHCVHQASKLDLLEEGSHLASRDGHLYRTTTAQELLMLAQQGGASYPVGSAGRALVIVRRKVGIDVAMLAIDWDLTGTT